MPATITVNSVLDSNARDDLLTYREALLVANGSLGVGSLSAAEQAQITGAINSGTGMPPDVIAFNIPGAGVRTIVPATALPDITDPVVIDGTTQPGTAANSLPSGTNATLLIAAPVPTVESGFSTIRGLIVTGGIVLRGGNNHVEGNFIGTNASGTQAAPAPATRGIVIESDENVIGGADPGARNLISGHSLAGIHISGGSSNRILGNLIGVNALGNQAIPNGIGVWISNGAGNSVGGSAAGAGNVISGNVATGVRIAPEEAGDSVTGNAVAGNRIGTSAAGSTAVGNGNGVFISAAGTAVGGTAAGAGNVISGNPGGGLGIFNSTNTLVLGNRVGTTADGLAALGNGDVGIAIGGGSGTSIGGTAAGARNVISGNLGHGVIVNTPGADTAIVGNFVGVSANGVNPMGNASSGVRVVNAGEGVVIGGATINHGNVIYYNRAGGVVVDAGTRVDIRTNSIYGNVGPGIDLGADGNTPNDPTDADTGPNNLQNAPVLTAIASDGATSTINGTLQSTPNTQFKIQFFSNTFADPTNVGEGQIFLGEADVTTDGSGVVNFIAAVGAGVAGGQPVTAVAIDPQGNTSEFSTALPFTPNAATDLGVVINSPVDFALTGQNVTFSVVVSNHGPNPASNVSLVAGLTGAATIVSVTTSQGAFSTQTGAIEASLGTLAPGLSATVNVVLRRSTAGTLGVAALVYSAAAESATENNTATRSVSVLNPPDLAVSAAALPSSPANVDLMIVFSVTNPGPADATSVVLTTDALPAGTTLVSASSSQGALAQDNGVVTATFGTLPGGGQATLTVVLHPTNIGSLVYGATATLAEADPNTVNNRGAASVAIVAPPDVLVEVTGAPNPVFVNQPITYLVTVRNPSAGDAQNVTINASLAPGATFISAQPSQGTATPGSGTITANLGPLAAGATAAMTIVVTPSAPGTATLNAAAIVPFDTNTSNNQGSASVLVNALPPAVSVVGVRAWTLNGALRGFVLMFTGPLDPVTAGQAAAYTVRIAGRNVPVRRVGYDVVHFAVTIDTQRALPLNTFILVGASGAGPAAILAGPDAPIDGDGDGTAGGDFFATVARGSNLNYIDRSGDNVRIRLAGLGSLEMVRDAFGDARSLVIHNAARRRSTLSGSVRRGRGGAGDGVTRIPVVVNLHTVRNRLPRARFLLGVG